MGNPPPLLLVIEATVAPTAKAAIRFNTFSGDIRTDLRLTFTSKSRRSVRATLNATDGGGTTFTFKTFSGNVRLSQRLP